MQILNRGIWDEIDCRVSVVAAQVPRLLLSFVLVNVKFVYKCEGKKSCNKKYSTSIKPNRAAEQSSRKKLTQRGTTDFC